MSANEESCALHSLGRATRNSESVDATGRATGAQQRGSKSANSPMTGRELRTQLRAQQGRNPSATEGNVPVSESCGGATAAELPQPLADPGMERRRAKALALLEANPAWRRSIVVEAGDPTIIGIAIRGVAYGEIAIPADRYDALALLDLMDRHATETIH